MGTGFDVFTRRNGNESESSSSSEEDIDEEFPDDGHMRSKFINIIANI